MTNQELYALLRQRLQELLREHHLTAETVTITAKGLTAEEAIGNPERKDYPILTGSEVMLMARFRNGRGQAFTDAPAQFSGSLQEILDGDIEHDPYTRAMFIAALNAVMAELGLACPSVHCRNKGPQECAGHVVEWVKTNHPHSRIAMVGYQPAMASALAKEFEIRVLDLNPENIGQHREGFTVLDGNTQREAVIDWADLVLCTGSTICNGTLINFLDLPKPTVFFGTTLSGAAPLLGLQRLCFADVVG